MFYIDEKSKNKVYEEFNRTLQMVDEDVDTLKKWMRSQPHLPELMDDSKIRNFLHLNKFSIEKTKQKIDMYYTIRTLIPDLFVDSNPKLKNMQRAFDNMYFGTHPDASKGLHRVYFTKFTKANSFCPEEAIKLIFCIFEIRLYEDFMSDDILVFDFANISFNDLKKFTPSLLSKGFAVYKKVYSLRLKNIYYLNSPSYVSYALAILKAVLQPKIFDRIKVHQDTEGLNEIFSKSQIPKDYGGDGPSLQELTEMTKRKFSDYQKRFDVLDHLKVDESLRPEKLNNDEILGFYGNFRKLDVD